MQITIAIFSFLLLLLCLFTLLLVLVQKPRADGGLGAALGGGSMEAALGAESSNVLNKTTIYSVIGFFILTFALYLGNLTVVEDSQATGEEGLLSDVIEVEDGDVTPSTAPTGSTLEPPLPEIGSESTGQEVAGPAGEGNAGEAAEAGVSTPEEGVE
ncbi:MAG: preprotein translocase subunit SecG [Opitutae bacterium]|nr:preprotein translocase subunit SecG [Opitutae bacterium]MBC9889172.1 preprotein translocase subunit SecG [Opitutae bacterium]